MANTNETTTNNPINSNISIIKKLLDYPNAIPILLAKGDKRAKIFILCSGLAFVILLPFFYFLFSDLSTTASIQNMLSKSDYKYQTIKVQANSQTRKPVWAIVDPGIEYSFASLRQNLSKFDNLVIQYGVIKEHKLELQDDSNAQEIFNYLDVHKPQASKYLNFQLSDGKVDDQTQAQIVTLINKQKFNGLALELSQNFDSSNLLNLSLLLQKNNLKLTLNIPDNLNPVQLEALSRISSSFLISYTDSARYNITAKALNKLSPNSNPSKNQVAAILDPSSKLYKISSDGEKILDQNLSLEAGMNILNRYQIKLGDLKNLNYKYSENDQKYELQIIDGPAIYNQLQNLERLKAAPTGIGLDFVGTEEPADWSILFTNDNQKRLDFLTNQYQLTNLIQLEGQGEIFEIASEGQYGQRSLGLNSEGYINSESIKVYPTKTILRRSGFKENSYTLTFDDGCDPTYTPQILDILKANNIKGTFYVIGEQVQKYPEVARRIVDEGHTIANHTFTHPYSSTLSNATLATEIAATNQIVEDKTGSTPTYFRVPYNDVNSYETESDTNILQIAGADRLKLAGFDIDPRDWEVNDKDKIIANVLEGLKTKSSGQILLHDSGADRSSTVEALPIIIQTLKQRGSQIVSTDQLVQTTSLKGVDTDIKTADANSGGIVNTLKKLASSMAIKSMDGVAIILNLCLFLSLSQFAITLVGVGLALLKKRAQKSSKNQALDLEELSDPLSVSILVPCYNEALVVQKTIDSLLASNYCQDYPKKFEIVVIDDGSKDNTYAVLRANYSNNPRIKLLTKQNGGKARALNYGLSEATGEIIVSLDADTILHPEAVTKLLKHFTDPKVGGVAGNVIVGNSSINLITKCQNLEYTFSQNFTKIAQEYLGCITVVPGAIGAWRKQILIDVGGLEPDTLAEDADLTIRVLERGWVIKYEGGAFSITEAPENWVSFWKQRFRWQFGMLQVLVKQRHLLFNWNYKALGFFAMPGFLLFYFFTLISPITNLVIIIYAIKFIWYFLNSTIMTFSQSEVVTAQRILTLFLAYCCFDLITNLIALKLAKNPNKKYSLLFYMVPQIFIIKPFLYLISVKVIIKALLGKVGGWNHLKRTGSVKA